MQIIGTEPTLVNVGETTIAANIGGSGPPVLLLHGYPQSRAMWHLVAPRLAEHYTVIAADLRGYGDSGAPQGDVYDKRSMARDQLALMRHLGFERFAVIGHDRGGRVAHRLALDAPNRVNSVAALDIVPTLHMFENVDRAIATGYFHWFFLTQPTIAEELIRAAPSAWLQSRFAGRSLRPSVIDPLAAAEYERCFDTDTIAASCADYRAAATVDLDHDRADLDAARTVDVPLLAIWGEGSFVGRNFDVLQTWQPFCTNVTGHAVPSDHYVAEEAPDQTVEALLEFLATVHGATV